MAPLLVVLIEPPTIDFHMQWTMYSNMRAQASWASREYENGITQKWLLREYKALWILSGIKDQKRNFYFCVGFHSM